MRKLCQGSWIETEIEQDVQKEKERERGGRERGRIETGTASLRDEKSRITETSVGVSERGLDWSN